MASLLPKAELVARFRADAEPLLGDRGPVGVAVSGGPDSLALLLLAGAAYPEVIRAATVDHRLRPESAREAEFVGEICARLGVPHDILVAKIDRAAASLQQSARAERYRLLGSWADAHGSGALATAHHLDDQAETLLMRLVRGSGVAGLAGVRARGQIPGSGSKAVLVRPLLKWRKRELVEIVAQAGLEAVADPSNDDPRYDRCMIRKRLADNEWLEPAALARTAAALADANEAIGWIVQRLGAERVSDGDGDLAFDPNGLPAEVRRRLVAAILRRLNPDARDLRGQELGDLIATLEAGRTATLAGVKASGGASWRFERAPPHRRSG